MFKEILNDVVKWKSLKKLFEYKGESKYHYKYLNIVFNKWSNGKLREQVVSTRQVTRASCVDLKEKKSSDIKYKNGPKNSQK
jgi:hypothetical protein